MDRERELVIIIMGKKHKFIGNIYLLNVLFHNNSNNKIIKVIKTLIYYGFLFVWYVKNFPAD